MMAREAVKKWEVFSFTDPNRKYIVSLYADGTWACSCPHHIYRKAICKHINFVKIEVSAGNEKCVLSDSRIVWSVEKKEFRKYNVKEIVVSHRLVE